MRMVAINTWISTRRWLFSPREPQVDMKSLGGSRVNRSAGKYWEYCIEAMPKDNQRTLKEHVREYALYSAAHAANF